MPELNIVYYDPFNPDEEAYVAEHYCDGQRQDLIARFYEAMREWRIKRPPIPHYEASDMAHYPDMAYAGGRAGILAMGMMIIRNHQREYWRIEREKLAMKIQTVSVECHEKRAHPSEMGHFDSKVELTAELDPGENADIVVAHLQYMARQQVGVECSRWIEEIKTREAQDKARNDLQWLCDRLENRLPDDRDTEQFDKKLILLPLDEHTEWQVKLFAAQGEYLSRCKRDLDRIVERVGRRGATARDESDVDELIAQLSEDERQGYIDKMSDAMQAYELSVAPQPGGTVTQVEIKGSSGKEEVPF